MHGGRLLRIGASMDLGGLMARAMGGGLVWVLGSCARVREALSVNVCRSIWRRDVVEVLRGGHSTAVPTRDCPRADVACGLATAVGYVCVICDNVIRLSSRLT
mgnify:CR=1 FL=1